MQGTTKLRNGEEVARKDVLRHCMKPFEHNGPNISLVIHEVERGAAKTVDAIKKQLISLSKQPVLECVVHLERMLSSPEKVSALLARGVAGIGGKRC
jgi:hypothetical protein